MLIADRISTNQIEVAGNLKAHSEVLWLAMIVSPMTFDLIKLFCNYSGLKHCTINLHLLSYLPSYVKLYGPLWTHSYSAFEVIIGTLSKKSHATHDIANHVR